MTRRASASQARGEAAAARCRQRGVVLRRQRGVVLFIALIVLVAMSLAGIALVRSVDTALGIAGNMAFKQATIQGSDRGVQAAYDWLVANSAGATLQNTNAATGYYSSQPGAEPNWFDSANWPAGAVATLDGGAPDAAGNVVRYVIHRMCTQANTAYNGEVGGVPNQCALSIAATGGAGGSMAVGAPEFQGTPQVYYRITTRVDGPRNTSSVIQVSVLIRV
jgi:Tfp pilus assembly protein PilX